MFQKALEAFVNLIFAPLVLVLALFGNTVGLIVLQKKSLNKIGPRRAFSYLLFMDSFYIVQIITPYLLFGYSVDLTVVSSLTCKLYQYFNYSLCSQSSMILVFISVDRLVSIKYPLKIDFFRKTKTTLGFFILINVYNLLYYLPIAFYYDVQSYIPLNANKSSNETQLAYFCNFIDEKSQLILGWMDLTNRVLVPFKLMIILSSILVFYIFKTRRHANLGSNIEQKHFHRDLKFSITCITLNLIYVAFNLPISITVLYPDYYLYLSYPANLFLFYASYAVNFYVLYLSNSQIRRECLNLFRFRFQLNLFLKREDKDTSLTKR